MSTVITFGSTRVQSSAVQNTHGPNSARSSERLSSAQSASLSRWMCRRS